MNEICSCKFLRSMERLPAFCLLPHSVLRSTEHKIQSLLNKLFLFQDEPKTSFIFVVIHLIYLMCNAVFDNTSTLTQLVNHTSGV